MQRIAWTLAALAAMAAPAAAGTMLYATAATPGKIHGWCLGPNGAIASQPRVEVDTAGLHPSRIVVSNATGTLYAAENDRVEAWKIGPGGELTRPVSPALDHVPKPKQKGVNSHDITLVCPPATASDPNCIPAFLHVPERSQGRITTFPLGPDGVPLAEAFTSCVLGPNISGFDHMLLNTHVTPNLLYASMANNGSVAGYQVADSGELVGQCIQDDPSTGDDPDSCNDGVVCVDCSLQKNATDAVCQRNLFCLDRDPNDGVTCSPNVDCTADGCIDCKLSTNKTQPACKSHPNPFCVGAAPADDDTCKRDLDCACDDDPNSNEDDDGVVVDCVTPLACGVPVGTSGCGPESNPYARPELWFPCPESAGGPGLCCTASGVTAPVTQRRSLAGAGAMELVANPPGSVVSECNPTTPSPFRLFVEARYYYQILGFNLDEHGAFDVRRYKKTNKTTPCQERLNSSAQPVPRQRANTKTNSDLRYLDLALAGGDSASQALLGTQFVNGRVDAYRLDAKRDIKKADRDDPQRKTAKNVRTSPVRMTLATFGGRQLLYVGSGSLDKIQVFELNAQGIPATNPFSQTDGIPGSFPNDVALAVIPGACNDPVQ